MGERVAGWNVVAVGALQEDDSNAMFKAFQGGKSKNVSTLLEEFHTFGGLTPQEVFWFASIGYKNDTLLDVAHRENKSAALRSVLREYGCRANNLGKVEENEAEEERLRKEEERIAAEKKEKEKEKQAREDAKANKKK